MQTHCIREKQIEVGIIEHEGREFAALGATVVGRSVTCYTRLVDGEIHLATWCGETMLACRCEIVERFWDGSLALMFRLPKGRFIVGYALSDNGMLFRGELLRCGPPKNCNGTSRPSAFWLGTSSSVASRTA